MKEATHTYTVTGMHCAACVRKIEAALGGLDAVTHATVTLDPPRAGVTMSPALDLDTLNAAVAEAGAYRLSQASAEAAANAPAPAAAEAADAPPESLSPLFLIVGYLAGAVLLAAAARGDFAWPTLMRHFMAGFFLVFSFFKLLDLRGFADTFAGYDLFARRSRAYALAYPFVELALGAAYLTNTWPTATNLVTLAVMGFGAVGVLRVLLDKRSSRCACLGTALNLPMTKVTLIENLTMVAMAATMLVLG